MNVYEMIEKQQQGLEDTTAYIVGEQLKEICRRDPACAAIVAEDLTDPAMGISHCEKKIKEFADGLHKKKKLSAVGVSAKTAEGIIRKFYGLPDGEATPDRAPEQPVEVPRGRGMLDLDDLLGM